MLLNSSFKIYATVCSPKLTSLVQKRSKIALANLPHNGSEDSFHTIPGTVSLPKGYSSSKPETLTCMEDYCLLGSMILSFYGTLNKERNTSLSDKIIHILDPKASKCKKNTAMKMIFSEVKRLQKLKNLPLQAEKQVFDIIIPSISDEFGVNCVVHDTSQSDAIIYQYPRIFDEERRTIHLHSLQVDDLQGHISAITKYSVYKRKMGFACLFCEKSDNCDNYIHRCNR